MIIYTFTLDTHFIYRGVGLLCPLPTTIPVRLQKRCYLRRQTAWVHGANNLTNDLLTPSIMR